MTGWFRERFPTRIEEAVFGSARFIFGEGSGEGFRTLAMQLAQRKQHPHIPVANQESMQKHGLLPVQESLERVRPVIVRQVNVVEMHKHPTLEARQHFKNQIVAITPGLHSMRRVYEKQGARTQVLELFRVHLLNRLGEHPYRSPRQPRPWIGFNACDFAMRAALTFIQRCRCENAIGRYSTSDLDDLGGFKMSKEPVESHRFDV